MLTRSEKEKLLEDITREFGEDSFIAFTDYRGLNVKAITALRRELRGVGARFQVIKKTLLTMASRKKDLDSLSSILEGQIGVVFSKSSEVKAAKTLHTFSKSNQALKILGGILNGKVISKSEVVNLASLPSEEELRARFVGTIAGPLFGFRNVLEATTRSLVYQLHTLGQNKK